MTIVSSSLWNDILDHLRLSQPEIVRGWFVNLVLGAIDHGVIEIQAANDAQVQYLERHCQACFAEAAQAATGRLVSVAFTCGAQPEDGESAARLRSSLDDELPLNRDFTFEHFVTGPCNRLAHAAAVAVADDPGRTYNPLFIHGPVGLGKTHLLQAVCHSVRSKQPLARFYYISCEAFTNHFIDAVERGTLYQFRYRYRHVDGLVIDDIQLLAERERSQEEFFHTFNALHQSQRQIILSADCCPAEIPSLEERLVSRFNSGLVALMDRPCLETRMAIVQKKAKLRCIEVPESVVRLIASRIDTNIRELEGALLRVDALSQTNGGSISLDVARQALGDPAPRAVPIGNILDTVSRFFDVKPADLQSKRRSKSVTVPRHVCMYLARQLTPLSFEEIGGYFGGRDHTTVLHGTRSVGQLIKQDPSFGRRVDEIATEIRLRSR